MSDSKLYSNIISYQNTVHINLDVAGMQMCHQVRLMHAHHIQAAFASSGASLHFTGHHAHAFANSLLASYSSRTKIGLFALRFPITAENTVALPTDSQVMAMLVANRSPNQDI